MKQVNLTLLFLAIFSTAIFAQDPAKKSFKKAKSNLVGYYTNQAKNIGKLEAAKEFIDGAITNISELKPKDFPKVYEKAGEIYKEVAKNANLKAKNADAAFKSMEYYIKAADDANVKSYQKDAIRQGLEDLGGVVFVSDGNAALQAKEYATAQKSFEAMLTCKEKVDALGGITLFLVLPADQNNIKFYAGYSAYLAGDKKVAKKYFEMLSKDKYDEATVYSFLSKIYLEEEETEKSIEAINQGVKVLSNVPIDETGEDKKAIAAEKARISGGLKTLLFDKINYYLKTKEMEKLEVELKKAIDQDPKNAQLPFTLGQVYEDLSSKAFDKGNDEEGEKYFESAVQYYTQTVEVDAKFFDAIYQGGAIYFNNAVRVYKIQAALGFTKEDQATSKVLGDKINSYYEKAWAEFVKAEKVKANDALLITAFKQIYLRVNNNDAYKEYKDREDKLKADDKTQMEAYAGHPATLFKK
jgi:hypothetical protein